MKAVPPVAKLRFIRHLNACRLITGAGFIVAMALMLAAPLQMPDPDDWAYYHGVRNFSDGRLTVDNDTQYAQAMETFENGNILLQYLHIDHDTWALEKAPGVVFYLVPFYKLGLPRWGNVLLALGMVMVTYLLLGRLRDERAAMIGSLLALFTPIGLVMLNRVYMDTFASLAFLVIGGGLYLYYHLERSSLTPAKSGTLLFLAFFFTGWSVIARYTNLPVAVILAVHLVVTRIADRRKGRKAFSTPELVPLALGIGLPLAAILLYDYYVFGSALSYSYSFSPYPIKFAFQYVGQVDTNGESIPLQILRFNSVAAARNLLIGFPLLVIGVPGFIAGLYFKFFRTGRPEGKWSGLRSEIPWDILLVLAGWFVSVFFLYLTYEWTAGIRKGGGFVIFDRFLLPGLFPVVVVCALVMARFPLKILVPVMAVLVIFGVLVYSQWAWDLHVLPHWLTERTLESRWPGYLFPPWTEAGAMFYP